MLQKKLWSKDFIALLVSSLFMALAFFALMPTLPVYLLNALKISPGNVGILIAAFPIAAILVRLVSGYLIDNYYRVRLLIVSLSLVTAGYVIYPLIGGVLAIFLLRLVHGAMWGVCTASSATIVADVVPPSRLGQGIGIYASTMPIGMTVGPLFGFALLKAQGPYVMFLAICGASILSLIGAFCTRAPYKPTARKKFSFVKLFHKKALPISLCMFFVMIVYGAIIAFVGIYAAQKDFPNVGIFFLCLSAAVFMSRVCAGRFFDRGHLPQLILAGHALAAAGTLWLGYAENSIQFLAAGMIGGLGFGTLMPTCQAAINTLVKSSERGAANSTYLTSYDLGLVVSSLVIGFLSDQASLAQLYRYSTCLIILSAVIFVFGAIPHYRRSRSDGSAIS